MNTLEQETEVEEITKSTKSTLKQATKVEEITKTGVIDEANVMMRFSRENENQVRQITVNANKVATNGQPTTLCLDWQTVNRYLTITVSNCGLDDVPFELAEKLLIEMQAVS